MPKTIIKAETNLTSESGWVNFIAYPDSGGKVKKRKQGFNIWERRWAQGRPNEMLTENQRKKAVELFDVWVEVLSGEHA